MYLSKYEGELTNPIDDVHLQCLKGSDLFTITTQDRVERCGDLEEGC